MSIRNSVPYALPVTFAIATRNRGPILVDCLRRTLANGLPESQFEIVIIDNASTDATPELIAREFPGNRNITLIPLQKNCGPVAKNIAIRRAKGEFIILLDDDAYPHPGSVPQMIRHFREDKSLAAAVFDITLPDGSHEASAYPDVFIGAGTGLRTSALKQVGGLPGDFFMQAEEYDLSFRLIHAGYSVQRFWDLPLTHLKSPDARIGQRTTRLDVRNNLYLLAKYIPEPLCHQLAADWLARYWMMAELRDAAQPPHPHHGTHKQSWLRGAAEGLAKWTPKRHAGRHLLSPEALERIFKFQKIHDRLARARDRLGARTVLFADLGKNIFAYWKAARALNLEIRGILEPNLTAARTNGSAPPRDYRGIPLLPDAAPPDADMIVVSNLSPVQAPRRAAALRRTLRIPVIDLFSRQDGLMQPSSRATPV